MVTGYCFKCKAKGEISDPKYELNKRGSPVVRGKHSKCGTAMYKILSASEVPAELKSKMSKKGKGEKRSRAKSRRGGSRKSRPSRRRSKKTHSRK